MQGDERSSEMGVLMVEIKGRGLKEEAKGIKEKKLSGDDSVIY